MSETSNRFEILEVQLCTVPVFKPRLFRCKIGTLNVRTASTEDKVALILREANKAGLMIIGLQEFRWMDKGEISMIVDGVKWTIIWSGGDSRMHGVAMCFKASSRVKIGEFQQVSERILSVDCEISGVKLRILNSYAPTNSYSLNYKESFYQELVKCSVIEPDSKRKLIGLGDFNSFVSSMHEKCNFDGNIDNLDSYDSTESGQLFLDYCAETKLGSLSTFYTHKWAQRATYYSCNKTTVRVYDHILAGPWIRKFTTDCRVRNSINVFSDHRCVVASFNFPAFKRDRVLTKSKKRPKKTRKLDYRALLKNDEINGQFLENVETGLENSEFLELSDLNTILNNATRVIPEI